MAIALFGKKKMSNDDFVMLCTTLSWMISSGLSVREGVVELLADKNNKMNRHALEVLRDDLDAGKVLSQVLRDNEDVFGEGYWRQVDAAERTGKVPECLTRLADQIRNSGDLVAKVRNAMIYPGFILGLAFAAGYYMFTTIVPQMGDMMAEFGIELPALTQMMMNAANFLIANGLLCVAVAAGVVFLIHYLLTKTFRLKWHETITKIPFVGQVSINLNYATAYMLLNDMIENGANIVEALRVASSSSGNLYIRQELEDTADRMDLEGIGLTEGLTSTNTMPSDDKLMLTIGQRTGREMELLPDLAVRRRKQAYDSVNTVIEIIPTVLLVVVAGIVGVMVVSIYMPMISMATDIA